MEEKTKVDKETTMNRNQLFIRYMKEQPRFKTTTSYSQHLLEDLPEDKVIINIKPKLDNTI
ncbi:MAG: hypothetical protein GY861_14120 [bacterium]|nr:hypothetical protein [bacterium]